MGDASMSECTTPQERDSREYPRLRPVEAFPVQTENQQAICIRDPQNIASNMLILPPPAFFLITLFDGEHSILDLQEAFMRKFQEIVPRAKIEEIIAQLNSELYLESETFYQAVQDMEKAFRASPIREAVHAGTAYETDPAQLRDQLAQYFYAIENKPPREEPPKNGTVKVLIAPHIDLRRGGATFAFAYREIAKRAPSDLYLVFGTGHHSCNSLLTLTKKNYDTPLGPIETDVDFVERFNRIAGMDVFEEEWLHRDEHSVEFQAVFLRYVLGDSWKGKMVPILCGSFHHFVQEGISPRYDSSFADALDRLREMIEEYPGSVTLIASVDMSHVGKRFGHSLGIPESELTRVEREDQAVLDALLTGDAETFYRSIEQDKDRNHICGLSPIYMVLDIARPKRGTLLDYQQSIEPETESVVTFTGVSFYDT